MLNLLIAIVGDSYNTVNSCEKFNFNFERACTLRDIDISIDKMD
jgi:hypothetical protein